MTETRETPNPSEGELPETVETPTPEAGSPDAPESTEPDYKRMYLDAKSKVERVNALEAENAELKQRAEPPPAAQPVDDEAYWNDVQSYAERGDPVAKAILRERSAREQTTRDLVDYHHLREIGDEAERKEVASHYQKNRHRLGDINAARAEIREKSLATENAKLREDLKRASTKNDPDVVRTGIREIPASENNARKMSSAQFDQRQASLKSQGRHQEAMAEQVDLSENRILLSD